MDIELIWVGWCNTNGHDEIGASFKCDGVHYCGWCKRNCKMRFKKHRTQQALSEVQYTKESKYKEVEKFILYSLYEDFEKTLSEYLVFDLLKDAVI